MGSIISYLLILNDLKILLLIYYLIIFFCLIMVIFKPNFTFVNPKISYGPDYYSGTYKSKIGAK